MFLGIVRWTPKLFAPVFFFAFSASFTVYFVSVIHKTSSISISTLNAKSKRRKREKEEQEDEEDAENILEVRKKAPRLLLTTTCSLLKE